MRSRLEEAKVDRISVVEAAASLEFDALGARASRCDVDTALASREELVSGRWSLIDRFEADGRRYVLARRNGPEVSDLRGLSRSEAQVAERLSLGHSEKQIAYTLGLSPSSVSRRIHRSIRKLGLRSRTELAALFASLANGVATRELDLGGESLLVGLCASPSAEALRALSPAEREVARLACHGRSDAEIARERGASARTIANQLGAIYRKLGIHSRTELAARVSA